MRASTIGVLAAASLVALPFAVRGQSVQVRVAAAESGAVLQGVFVSLVGADGRVVRSALTDAEGRSNFSLSRPGTVRVRAELIGRQTATSPPVEVRGQDLVVIPVALAIHAIALAEIRVEADQRCHLRSEEASGIARVWEDARKPLAVQAWVEKEHLYRLRVVTYERDLDGTGRTVQRESRRAASTVTRVPFASLPADDLLRDGFVRALEGGGHEYFGPDPTLLLSDPFLDTHCFHLTRSGEMPGEIGLAFEPTRAGGKPDIQGTMWVDEESSALRLIEYRYTWAPSQEAGGIAGGRLEIEALPDGAWMIGHWWIRAPILARQPYLARGNDSGIRVVAIRETGGEVTGVSTLAGEMITQSELGTVRGLVWDSTTSAPLMGATVSLSGTEHRAETDAEGRFVLHEIPSGVFTASFTHPRVDSLGVEASGTEVEVVAGRTTDVTLAVPSIGTILLATCQAEERQEGGAVLSGVVTDRATGQPLPGVRVTVEWQDVERAHPGERMADRRLEVGTNREGRYAVCGVPVGQPLQVRSAFLRTEGPLAEVRLSEEGYRALDLELELPAGAPDAGVAESVAQGVQGVLVDSESGWRIRAAAVTIRGSSGDVVASGLSDARGFFRLQTPASGAYVLSVHALGYGPVEATSVNVSLGQLSVLEISLAPEALELEPIVVTAEPRAFRLELRGFYQRQAEEFGAFISPEIMERRHPVKVSDVLFGIPGTYVAEPSAGMGGRAVYFRSGIRATSFSGGTLNPSDVCWPMVYVDRQLVSTGGSTGTGAEPTVIDEIVHPSDVEAMELYRSPAEVPSEFNGPNAGCGVIVIWTRRGGGDT